MTNKDLKILVNFMKNSSYYLSTRTQEESHSVIIITEYGNNQYEITNKLI